MKLLLSGKNVLNLSWISAFVLSLIVTSATYLYLGLSWQKALFGFFWFLLTPILVIPAFPVSVVVLVILFLLFRRVGSCMRTQWQWIAYMLLFLHWEAWGFYCSSYLSA